MSENIIEREWKTGARLAAKQIIVVWGGRKRHRCGYVAVPVGHPLYGKGYDDVSFSVHGGLTFAGTMEESDDRWWLGFDCAHGGDGTIDPDPNWPGFAGDVTRSAEYVSAECESLAAQIVVQFPPQ